VLDAWGKTGGQLGDPLEMMVFCLTVHHLWGRTLAKHNQDACAVAYADDGYIKAKLSVALEVLSDIKQVLKEDAGLALNDKTKILVKGISASDARAAAQRLLIADPSLTHLSPLLSPASFVVDGYIGLGVPIGTDAFIQHFVKDKCQAIMEDVDQLDNIPDGFIHYQLIRFCQATRLQYLNGHVQLANQNVLQQQQHVDHKITLALLKKGTRDAYKTWHQQDRAWVDMRFHESHDEGGFGVTNNVITRHAASYTTNARFVTFLGTFASPAQQVWLPCYDLQDPATWDAPPLRQLKHVHEDLLQHYDCTDQPAAAQQAPPSAGGSAAAAGANPQPRPAGSQAQTRSLGPQAPRTTATANSSSPATQLPPRGIQAESGFPPGVFQLSGPAHSAQAHSVATPSHPALHSPCRNEWAGGASRQCPGPRPLLEAPLLARGHQTHIRQRCLRPSVVDDVCLHDARCGGSRAELPPPPQ
jgi:hypothetical protein